MNSYHEPESDPAVLEYSHEPPLLASPANADLRRFAPSQEQAAHNTVQDARGEIKEEENGGRQTKKTRQKKSCTKHMKIMITFVN